MTEDKLELALQWLLALTTRKPRSTRQEFLVKNIYIIVP